MPSSLSSGPSRGSGLCTTTSTFAELAAGTVLDSSEIEAWLDSQDEGVPLAPFKGEPRELALIRTYMHVLIARHVSLACFIPKDRGCELYLTKETNDMPECMVKLARCEYCDVTEVDVRKAYLVIQVEDWVNSSAGRWSEVMVAELSLDALDMLALALPSLGSANRTIRESAVEAIDENTSWPGQDCAFVWATIFNGLRLPEEEHWFFGLTHAPRAVTENGEAWLACPYAGQRMLLLKETLSFTS